MVQVIEQSDRFGRIGKAFGEGLGEQIPKEVDRYRLNKGLERFKNESLTKTPIEQAIDLYKIPGITPEIGYTLAPLLKQQQQRNEGQMPVGQSSGQFTSQPNGQSQVNTNPGVINVQGNAPTPTGAKTPFKEENIIAQANQGLKSKETSVIQRTPFIEPSQQERFNRAQQISQKFPQNFPTPNDALPFVNNQIAIERANYQAQQQAGTVADNQQTRLRQDLERKWGVTEKGAQGFTKDIPIAVQNRIYTKMEDEFADPNNKLSENQLTDKWYEVGKDIAMSTTSLKGLAGNKWTAPQNEIKRAMENVRKSYQKIDGNEDLANLYESDFGLSPDTAAKAAYGISKPIKSILDNFKPSGSFRSPIGLVFGKDDPLNFIENDELRREQQDTLTKAIVNDLTKDDSLLAIAFDLKNKGYDPREFLNKISELHDAEQINLYSRQIRELQKNIPTIPNLYDIYFKSMSGVK